MRHDRSQPFPDTFDGRAITLSVAGRSASMVFAALLMTFTTFSSVAPASKTSGAKPKVVVMTDGEIDDHSAMIRFLLYTSDVEVKASAGAPTGSFVGPNEPGKQIHLILEGYQRVIVALE